MVCHRITYYKILSPQRRVEISAEMEACRTTRIVVGLPPDSPEKEEEQDAASKQEALMRGDGGGGGAERGDGGGGTVG